MKLKKWNIREKYLCGTVMGSDRYPDGTYIETSEVVTAAFDGSLFLVRTENSLYECELDDYHGAEETLEAFIRTMSEQQKRGTTRQLKK
jgi:hypothetical protein